MGVATTTGVTAQHIAKKFGFAYATTDYQEILRDTAIGRVMITTRHNLHGPLVLEALAAGKHVFVEKPLCLTEAELAHIEAAYDACPVSDGGLQPPVCAAGATGQGLSVRADYPPGHDLPGQCRVYS